VSDVPEGYGDDVGETPLHRTPSLGEAVWVKDESTNPSGSFKDRGLAMAVALGAACGAKRFCLPTQGNAGVAASMWSTRLGMPGALVYMPEGHRGSAYAQAAELYGGEVKYVGRHIGEAGAAMRADQAEGLAAGELVDVSTFFEPGRLEGKKTMGLELFEGFASARLPDWIFYPTGGGTGLVGIWKAFAELQALGALDPDKHGLPRMVVVQSERCAPVVQAFDRGDDVVTTIESQGTAADGLDVPGAIMGHGILRALAESEGHAIAVTEEAIQVNWRTLGRAGVAACYEGGAALAGYQAMRDSGQVAADDWVVILNTGRQR
jgi:threonine synthase